MNGEERCHEDEQRRVERLGAERFRRQFRGLR